MGVDPGCDLSSASVEKLTPNTHSPCRSLHDEKIGKAQRGFLLFISNRQAAPLQDI